MENTEKLNRKLVPQNTPILVPKEFREEQMKNIMNLLDKKFTDCK